MIYVGIYALIYLHTILHQGMDSRDGLPRGALPSGILKIEKYCPGHKVPVSKNRCFKGTIHSSRSLILFKISTRKKIHSPEMISYYS